MALISDVAARIQTLERELVMLGYSTKEARAFILAALQGGSLTH